MTIDGSAPWKALFKELRRLGYVEGNNLIVERYTGKGEKDSDATMAARIVGTAPDLIFMLVEGFLALHPRRLPGPLAPSAFNPAS